MIYTLKLLDGPAVCGLPEVTGYLHKIVTRGSARQGPDETSLTPLLTHMLAHTHSLLHINFHIVFQCVSDIHMM